MVIRDLAIQKRDREMAIGTYARGFFVADIAPMKEFKPEVFEKAAHLFQPQAAVKWNRFERRGETLGEMVRAINPPIGATIYYYLKADAQKVTVTIKDLEGTTVNEFTPTAKKGLQKAFWNLNRQAPPGAAPVGAGRGGRGGAEPGGAGAPGAAAPNPDQPPQAAPGGRRRARRARRSPGGCRRVQGDA